MVTIGQDYTCEHGEAHPCPHGCPETEAARAARLLAAVRSGDWLDTQDLPPVRWAVPGLIPEGLTLIVGPPKAGKSWLALDALLAVACGGRALGHIDVTPGPVLYMAMEDGDRRMRDRARHLLAGQPIPREYYYVTGDRVRPGEIVATVRAWMAAHPDTRMVVIDTLGRVMPPARQGETQYERDYRIGAALKAVADEHPGLAVLVVHHSRKDVSTDYVDAVSGTHGLAGAADAVIILTRERDSDEGTLSVTGRDVDEGTYALVGLPAAPRLDGRDLAQARARAAERAQAYDERAHLSDRTRAILAWMRQAGRVVSPAEVDRALGLPDRTAQRYMSRLVERGTVVQVGRGRYRCVASVDSVASPIVDTTHATHTRPHTDATHTTHTRPHLRLVHDDDLEDTPLWADSESSDDDYE